MKELDDSTPDLSTELRWLRQGIGDLTKIMAEKMDLNGPAVLDMPQAASYLATTKRSLYDLVKRGGIPVRKIGRKFVFRTCDLDAWLQQLPGITVAQAIATIKPEHRTMWVKGFCGTHRSAVPQAYTGLTPGPKGNHRARLKAAKR